MSPYASLFLEKSHNPLKLQKTLTYTVCCCYPFDVILMGRSSYYTSDFKRFTHNSHVLCRVHHYLHRLLLSYTKTNRKSCTTSWLTGTMPFGASLRPGHLLLSILSSPFTRALLLSLRFSHFLYTSTGSNTSQEERSSHHCGLQVRNPSASFILTIRAQSLLEHQRQTLIVPMIC